MNRRGFLKAILAAGVAPYVCTTAGVLMPGKATKAALTYAWSEYEVGFDHEVDAVRYYSDMRAGGPSDFTLTELVAKTIRSRTAELERNIRQQNAFLARLKNGN